MTVDLPEDLIARLRTLANKTAKYDEDEFEVYAWSGGNVDDAFDLGYHDGEISIAREVIGVIDAG